VQAPATNQYGPILLIIAPVFVCTAANQNTPKNDRSHRESGLPTLTIEYTAGGSPNDAKILVAPVNFS